MIENKEEYKKKCKELTDAMSAQFEVVSTVGHLQTLYGMDAKLSDIKKTAEAEARKTIDKLDAFMKEERDALICDLMNVSDEISKHTESKQERVEKLKEIVQKIIPEKMESYLHTSEDMSRDLLGRFHNDDILNMLLSAMKYDLIQYIANI